MARRGFTLVELLVIVAIIGTMLAAAVASVGAGMSAVRMKSSTRRVLMLSRQARSMALLRQQPAVITYSETWEGGEFVGSKVKIESRAESDGGRMPLQSLSGYETYGGDEEGDGGDASGQSSDLKTAMENVEDDSFVGIRLKVELLDQTGHAYGEKKQSISVFSNVDYLLKRARESVAPADGAKEEEKEGDSDGESASATATPSDPVSIVYETNGRCPPHRITVYKDGQDESKGLVMEVDRFGAVKVQDDE